MQAIYTKEIGQVSVPLVFALCSFLHIIKPVSVQSQNRAYLMQFQGKKVTILLQKPFN